MDVASASSRLAQVTAKLAVKCDDIRKNHALPRFASCCLIFGVGGGWGEDIERCVHRYIMQGLVQGQGKRKDGTTWI